MEPSNYMKIYSLLAQMGYCFYCFSIWRGGDKSPQNKPKRKLYVKSSILQSGSDQFKDAQVSRFGIQDFHGHI